MNSVKKCTERSINPQNNIDMRHIGMALIYIAFFSLIGFSLWVTKSVWVLLALIFTPEYESE